MKRKNFFLTICILILFSLSMVACELGAPEETQSTIPTASESDSDSNSPVASETVTVIPSYAPTDAPTEAPTAAPTEAPTAAPTEAPTAAPTEAPTAAPTEAPTVAPTEVPTDAPTEAPTDAPTEVPTDAPTEAPTVAPTEAPTDAPTEAPTVAPTEAPTETVTQAPIETDPPCDHAYRYRCSRECRYCGEKREISTPHSIKYDCSVECSLCHEAVEPTSPHTFLFDCSDSCAICRADRVDPPLSHSFPYDCTESCQVCGKTRKTETPHEFGSDSLCETLNCANCGLVVVQDHDWELISDTTSFLSAGAITKKCTKCQADDVTEYDPIDPATVGMPVIYIEDLEDAAIPLVNLQKADGEITVKYKYVSNSDDIPSFEGYSEIKIQGASSAGYPKKNFTVKLFEDEALENKLKVNLGWGKENKYCMKANYIDFSQARNIVAAQMFAQMVASRDYINPGLAAAPNYGLIDGYPVLVLINGEFHGIYTMNIPKDEWMFAMEGDETSREAMLMADAWTNSITLHEQIGDGEFADYGWEVEYCSTKDETWIKDSFNKLIALINCGDDARIKAELANHLDIEAAIDNMIFTYFINAADNVAKNILWATFDGEVWIPSMYDMDGTFGIYWNGDPIDPDSTSHSDAPRNTFPEVNPNGTLYVPGLKLYSTLLRCFPNEVVARYRALRTDILTVKNTRATFEAFFEKAPMIAYRSDAEKWVSVPYPDVNLTNMFEATQKQLARLDEFFNNFNS